MGKCKVCGRPTSDNSELCGFCKVSDKKPIIKDEKKKIDSVVIDKKEKILNQKSSVFEKYDDVMNTPLIKKDIKKKSETKKSVFSVYDDVDKSLKSTHSSNISIPGVKIPGVKIPGVNSVISIFVVVFAFVVTLSISANVQSALNTSVMPATVHSMVSLIPLVLVGAGIIGVITMTLRLTI